MISVPNKSMFQANQFELFWLRLSVISFANEFMELNAMIYNTKMQNDG